MEYDEARSVAAEFDELFRRVYSTYHRRDGTRRPLSGASIATLNHLAFSGPVSVGDAATHLSRSQSTTSEILDQLERNGLVERRVDPDNGRRTLVWLTDAGMAALRAEQSVLGLDLLEASFAQLDTDQADRIVAALHLLLDTAPPPHGKAP